MTNKTTKRTAANQTVLRRVRYTVEILCDPADDPTDMDLELLPRCCIEGDMSGRVVGWTSIENLSLRQALLALKKHGTDPEFFSLPDHAVGSRVWWNDPDNGACSGWYTVAGYQGGVYRLKNEAGSEAEAFGNEVSKRKTK